MLHYRTDRRPHATRRWEIVTGPYPVTASTHSSLELADTIAQDLLRDDPEIRAARWQEDRRVVVVGSDPCQASIRIILGGAALRATEWWRTFDDARRNFITDCKLRGTHDIFQAETAWTGSHVRAALLARRPLTVDPDPDPDATDGQDDDLMNFTQDTATAPNQVQQLAEQIIAASPTAAAELTRPGGTGNLVATILAEFLAGADYAPRNWWTPARHSEPDPETTSVYDGKINYTRVLSGWEATDQQDQPIYTWQDIPAPLVVDSSRVKPAGWKLHNPAPGSPIAHWHARSPEEVRQMLQTAIEVLAARVGVDPETVAVGTQWTPAEGQPIFLIMLGKPGDEEITALPATAAGDDQD